MWIYMCIKHIFCLIVIIHHKRHHFNTRTTSNMNWFDACTKKMSVSSFGSFIKLIKVQCAKTWVSPRHCTTKDMGLSPAQSHHHGTATRLPLPWVGHRWVRERGIEGKLALSSRICNLLLTSLISVKCYSWNVTWEKESGIAEKETQSGEKENPTCEKKNHVISCFASMGRAYCSKGTKGWALEVTGGTYVTQDRRGHPGYRAVQLRLTCH